MSGWEGWTTISFNVVLAQRGGRTVLVNTAPPDDTSPLVEEFPQLTYLHDEPAGDLQRGSAQGLLHQLNRRGISAADVTDVVLTPLELYTTSLLSEFRNARIHISRRGWRHFHETHEHPHDSRWRKFPREVLVDLVTESWDRVNLLDDEDSIAPGFRTWWAGGHHRETIVCEIEVPQGLAAVTDACFVFENVEQNLPLGLSESLEETMACYHRLRHSGALLIPANDLNVFERYPSGHVGQIRATE
jgi:hypothetical protein